MEQFRHSKELINQLLENINGKQTFFNKTRKSFDTYWRTLQQNKDERLTKEIDDLSVEALRRFDQLDFLLVEVKSLEDLSEKIRQKNINKTHIHIKWLNNISESNDYNEHPLTQEIAKSIFNDQGYEILTKIELFTESFYYIAHRLKEIIGYYPELKSFHPRGVIIVRNHLIEHPEKKDSKITSSSFGIGSKNGPKIKPLRTEVDHEKHVDAGLYENAKEFRDKLNYLLEKVLESYKK